MQACHLRFIFLSVLAKAIRLFINGDAPLLSLDKSAALSFSSPLTKPLRLATARNAPGFFIAPCIQFSLLFF